MAMKTNSALPQHSDTHHEFVPATPSCSRAPCPGLNALANHGYIPHSGIGITPRQLLTSITHVYNLSLPLALLLTVPAFFIYGHLNLRGWPWNWTLTLDLDDLSRLGHSTIGHKASFVHPNWPSHKPDEGMVKDFLGRGAAHTRDSAAEQSSTFPDQNSTSIPDSPKSSFSSTDGYLTLHDLARLRVDREAALPSTQKLNSLHEQIALGESALTWILFSTPPTCASSACSEKHPACISAPRIPLLPLAQFFGAERLPDGWWTSMRPKSSVGLLQARKCAAIVGKEMEEIRRAESTESDCQVGAA